MVLHNSLLHSLHNHPHSHLKLNLNHFTFLIGIVLCTLFRHNDWLKFTNQNNKYMLKLDFEGKDVQFSTHFKNICCVGTFDVLNWYHKGSIFVINTKEQRVLKKFDNKIGVHKLSLSENYPEILISANHDGSMNIWDINKSKMVSNIVCEEGYPLSSVNWNNLIQNLILVGSTSSRIELFDSNNFSEILTIFAEHTKSVNDVK